MRRIARPADRPSPAEWKADAVLIDGALLREPVASFGAPTFVLTGNLADADQLTRRLPDVRGCLPKDVTAADLRHLVNAVRVEPVPQRPVLLRLVAGALVTILLAAVVVATALALRIPR